jgi:predicted molibdopterin-dependent oxidoreductase YjgC
LFRRLKPRAGGTVAFTIDGEPAEAMAGDLLISAILLNRSSLRLFEFGDAERAGFCLMGACQDCWVTLADGARLRACTTRIEPGMAVVIGSRHA